MGAGPIAAVEVLLDTHALLWWFAGSRRLSKHASRAIDAANALHVSPLSCWEAATLHRLGRIKLDREPSEWVRGLLREDRIVLAQLSVEAAVWAGSLGDVFPGDPIDRLLLATARDLRVPFVSKDERLRDFATNRGEVKVIW